MVESGNKVELLQAGRVIACMAVILCHAGTYVGPRYGSQYYGPAVDFFFFVSGFAIYRMAARRFTLRGFARNRAFRVFLPYWPIGIPMAALYLWQGRDFSLLASLTLLPGETALHPAWTLQHELVFYVLAALGFRIGRPLLVMSLWAVLILLFGVADTEKSGTAEVLLNMRNLDFVVGMFAGAYLSIPHVPIGRLLNGLADASYSIYLAHIPAMGILWRFGADFWTLAIGGLAAGLAYYFAVERQIIRRRRITRAPVPSVPDLKQSTSPAS